VSISCGTLIVSNGLRQILLTHSIAKLIVLPNFEECFLKSVFNFNVALLLCLLEILKRKISVGLAINAFWMPALLEEDTDLVESIGLHVVCGIAVIC